MSFARSSCTFLRRISWLASSAVLENSWPLHILRRFLHRLETGIHGKPNSSCSWARSASGMVRLDKIWSCVWRTSLAMFAEEMTIVVTRPSFRLIMGP
jgi:hypothetical protein